MSQEFHRRSAPVVITRLFANRAAKRVQACERPRAGAVDIDTHPGPLAAPVVRDVKQIHGEAMGTAEQSPRDFATASPDLEQLPQDRRVPGLEHVLIPYGNSPRARLTTEATAKSAAAPNPAALPRQRTGVSVGLSQDPERLLVERELASAINIAQGTLRNWRVSGKGPPWVALSRRAIRYRRSDVEQWLMARVRRSTSEPDPGLDNDNVPVASRSSLPRPSTAAGGKGGREPAQTHNARLVDGR
jgi:hypothetical protein